MQSSHHPSSKNDANVNYINNDQIPCIKHSRSSNTTYKCHWDEEMHKGFIAAIFDFGLSKVKPKQILELWETAPLDLELDQIRSHLQNYRRNSTSARKMFNSQLTRSIAESQSLNKRRAVTPHLHAYPISGCKKHRLDIFLTELDEPDATDGDDKLQEQSQIQQSIPNRRTMMEVGKSEDFEDKTTCSYQPRFNFYNRNSPPTLCCSNGNFSAVSYPIDDCSQAFHNYSQQPFSFPGQYFQTPPVVNSENFDSQSLPLDESQNTSACPFENNSKPPFSGPGNQTYESYGCLDR